MLWVPYQNEFQWRTDNIGATYNDAGIGTSVPAHGINAHAKGNATSVLSAVAEDVWGISISFSGISTAGATRQYMCDLLVDPAGGTSWSTAISNLCGAGASLVLGMETYYFPLFLKAGTSIGAQCQCSTAGVNLRVVIRVFGKPKRPDMVRVGNKVQTIGATTASTVGVSFTPGSSAIGSYSASMGQTTIDAWWWQVGFISTDTTRAALAYFMDLSAGDGTTKLPCIEHLSYNTDASERAGKECFGMGLPAREMKTGCDVYVRGACAGTPDSSYSAVAYALGS